MAAKFTFSNRALLEQATRKAVVTVGLEILRDTVVATPVRSGTLARSFNVGDANNYAVEAGNSREQAFSVGTNVFYAPFVEFGAQGREGVAMLGNALEKARRKYGR